MNNSQPKAIQNKVGRPTSITNDVVAKLESVFKLSVTVETACKYAGINKTTFYRNYEKNEDFATKIDKAREFARIAAGQVVMDAIVNDKDVATARWWLEKKYPQEFASTGMLQQINIGDQENKTDLVFVLDEKYESEGGEVNVS